MPFWVLHIHTHSKPNPCWNKSPLLLSEHTYHILCTTHIHLNKVRPNPDIAPHLQSSWSWSWSSSSSPSPSHHDHHHIMIIITLKFATPSEQYVDWGNNINFIFMRDQNSPPPMNNMLIGVITSTLSSWGIKIRHLLRTICWLGK